MIAFPKLERYSMRCPFNTDVVPYSFLFSYDIDVLYCNGAIDDGDRFYNIGKWTDSCWEIVFGNNLTELRNELKNLAARGVFCPDLESSSPAYSRSICDVTGFKKLEKIFLLGMDVTEIPNGGGVDVFQPMPGGNSLQEVRDVKERIRRSVIAAGHRGVEFEDAQCVYPYGALTTKQGNRYQRALKKLKSACCSVQ